MAGLADLFEESYDPAVDDQPKPNVAVPVKPFGELTNRDAEFYKNQPAREGLSELARVFGQAIGYSPTKANQMGGDVTNWIDFMPIVGDMLGAAETKEAAQKGNYGEAALNAGATALGVVPVVGDAAAKTLKKPIKNLNAGATALGVVPVVGDAAAKTLKKTIKNLKGEAIEAPRSFFRGTNPGDERRIKTGATDWDSHFFAADSEDSARMYGSDIQKLEAAPDAKIAYEGTPEWNKIAGKQRKGESLLDYADRSAKALKAAGYDAAWFQRQSDVGTAIFNPAKFGQEPPASAVADTLAEATVPATKTFKHPISGVKLKTPLEEMQIDTKPFGAMREEKLLHPEWLLGKTVVPMRGDPAAAGQTLTGVGGKTFETPVDLHGGPGFPRMQSSVDQGVGWASQPGAATTQANRAADLAKKNETPVVGIYQKMSDRSTGYNTMLAETLHQMFKLNRSNIAQADVDEFDRIMREVPLQVNKKGVAERPAYPDWPGLDNLTPEYLRKGGGAKGDGKVRNKMFDLMDTKFWQDKGFPEAGYANYAITDKSLINKPTNTSGAAVVTYDPQGRTIDKVGHPTYSRGVVAQEEGVLPDLPLDVLYEGYRETGGTGGKPIANSHLEKFLTTKPPSLVVDEPTLERVMKYLRSQDGFKWGLGGAVAAGIISEEQARLLDSSQDQGASQ